MNNTAEKDWLKSLVTRAVVVRIAVALAFHLAGVSQRLAPDEVTYEAVGRDVAAYWRGDLLVRPSQLSAAEPSAYFYLNGISLYLFGSVLPLKLLNALLGGLVCRYASFLASALYGLEVAKRTTRFVAYYPSLVLWSALNIRDVWVIFLIVYLSWKSLQVVSSFSVQGLVHVLACIPLIGSFRRYLYFVVALPPIAALVIGKRTPIVRNLVLAFVAGSAIVLFVQQGATARPFDVLDLETLAQKRQGMAAGAQSSFEESADVSTPLRALAFLPVGLAYFWFSPFPWQITSLLKLLSLPEVLLVYAITPSVVRGFRVTVRSHLRDGAQVLLLTALITVSYALGSGNVGTLYRHRAQATVFYLMFAAVGIEDRIRLKQRRLALRNAPAVLPPGRPVDPSRSRR